MRDNIVIHPKELKPMLFNFIKTFFLPIKGFELIGFLLSLVPIVNFIVFGYALQVVRKAFLSEDVSLPEWKNLKHMFIEGIKFILFLIFVMLIPYLTAILLSFAVKLFNFTDPQVAVLGAALLVYINLLFFIIMGYLTPALIVLFAIKGFKKINVWTALKISFSFRYFITFILNIIFVGLITYIFMFIRIFYGAAGSYFVGRDLLLLALVTWWIMIMSSALFGLSIDNKHKSLIVAGLFAKNGKKKK